MAPRTLKVGGIGPSKQGVSRRARFKITNDAARSTQILNVEGDVTLETCGTLEFMGQQISQPIVVIDLSSTTMLSGAALAVLRRTIDRWKAEHRDVRFVADTGPIFDTLQKSHLLDTSPIYRSRRNALRGIESETNSADVVVLEAPEAIKALEKTGLDVLPATSSSVEQMKHRAPVLLADLRTIESLGQLDTILTQLRHVWNIIVVGPQDRRDAAEYCEHKPGIEYLPEPVIINDLASRIRHYTQSPKPVNAACTA